MGVVAAGSVAVGLSPDGKGLRWYGHVTGIGDATGGTVGLYLNHKPTQDEWVMIDRVLVYSNNANTDCVAIVPSGFSDPFTWGATVALDGGLTAKKIYNGWLWTLDYNMPIYLGRYVNNNADVMLGALVSPNTDTKQYEIAATGRFLFNPPPLVVKG